MVIRMTEEKLLDALGKIEDDMVLEAAPKGAASEGDVQKTSVQNGKQSKSRGREKRFL